MTALAGPLIAPIVDKDTSAGADSASSDAASSFDAVCKLALWSSALSSLLFSTVTPATPSRITDAAATSRGLAHLPRHTCRPASRPVRGRTFAEDSSAEGLEAPPKRVSYWESDAATADSRAWGSGAETSAILALTLVNAATSAARWGVDSTWARSASLSSPSM